jgi:hypothetical protein
MEMLKQSVEHHSLFVDEILICYQGVSNKGGRSYNKLPAFNCSTPISFMDYIPNLGISTKQNERIKHNEMIQYAKKQGFTHFILCACDHFYNHNDLEYAKQQHIMNDYDVSFSMMKTFYKKKNWFLDPLESYYMPFIHKMKYNTEISNSVSYPVLVDPSVKVNTCEKFKIFTPDEVLMNHYSMVRVNIRNKLNNAAASIRWTEKQIKQFIHEFDNAKPGDSISYFQGRKIIEE